MSPLGEPVHSLDIINGVLIADGEVRPADIRIADGVIQEVRDPGGLGISPRSIDATGLYVMPGAVDIHFHCRAPSHPERGTFASESGAAAAGGVTTIFEMPISNPACSTPEVLLARRSLAEQECWVDFGLFAGAAVRDRQAAEDLADAGAIGFKLFMIAPAPERVEEFRGLWAADSDAIYHSLESVRTTGLPCTVHAEDDSLVRMFREAGVDGRSRPPVIESTAIARLGAIAAAVGARVHAAHITSRPALAALTGARAAGALMTAETCPQYLILDEGTVERWGSLAKVGPPLRTKADQDALWSALLDGQIDAVASDHSPFLAHEKQVPKYGDAPQGLPTVESLTPTLLDAGLSGRLPLGLAVDLITSRPAHTFGIYPQKGSLRPGADADIALVDPGATTVLAPESLLTRAAGCALAYDNMRLRGRVVQTIVRGRTVYQGGKLIGSPRGRFVRPSVVEVVASESK